MRCPEQMWASWSWHRPHLEIQSHFAHGCIVSYYVILNQAYSPASSNSTISCYDMARHAISCLVMSCYHFMSYRIISSHPRYSHVMSLDEHIIILRSVATLFRIALTVRLADEVGDPSFQSAPAAWVSGCFHAGHSYCHCHSSFSSCASPVA